MSDWVIRLIDQTGYVGIFLLMLAETVFPPIPSEVIMPVAGLRAANGDLSLAGVVIAGTAGAMAGNFFWYLVARMFGLIRFRALVERYGRWLTLDWGDVEWGQRLFGRFGSAIVFLGRMIPTVRSVVSIPAGLVHMHLPRFLLWSAIGTAIWSAMLAAAGYLLGVRFGEIENIIGPVSSAVVIGVVLLYIWRQATWHRRHRD